MRPLPNLKKIVYWRKGRRNNVAAYPSAVAGQFNDDCDGQEQTEKQHHFSSLLSALSTFLSRNALHLCSDLSLSKGLSH